MSSLITFAPPARHLLKAKDLADARYFEPLDVADFAHAAGLSKAHFSREFRRTFGIDSGFRDPSGNSFRLTEVRDLVQAEV